MGVEGFRVDFADTSDFFHLALTNLMPMTSDPALYLGNPTLAPMWYLAIH